MERRAGEHERVVRRAIDAEIHAFFVVRRGRRIELLAADARIAVLACAFDDGDALLHRQGLIEEALGLGEDACAERRIDAMIGDIKESGRGAGVAELAHDHAMARRIIAAQRADIDDRQS